MPNQECTNCGTTYPPDYEYCPNCRLTPKEAKKKFLEEIDEYDLDSD